MNESEIRGLAELGGEAAQQLLGILKAIERVNYTIAELNRQKGRLFKEAGALGLEKPDVRRLLDLRQSRLGISPEEERRLAKRIAVYDSVLGELQRAINAEKNEDVGDAALDIIGEREPPRAQDDADPGF